jgi:hypothetical protein
MSSLVLRQYESPIDQYYGRRYLASKKMPKDLYEAYFWNSMSLIDRMAYGIFKEFNIPKLRDKFLENYPNIFYKMSEFQELEEQNFTFLTGNPIEDEDEFFKPFKTIYSRISNAIRDTLHGVSVKNNTMLEDKKRVFSINSPAALQNCLKDAHLFRLITEADKFVYEKSRQTYKDHDGDIFLINRFWEFISSHNCSNINTVFLVNRITSTIIFDYIQKAVNSSIAYYKPDITKININTLKFSLEEQIEMLPLDERLPLNDTLSDYICIQVLIYYKVYTELLVEKISVIQTRRKAVDIEKEIAQISTQIEKNRISTTKTLIKFDEAISILESHLEFFHKKHDVTKDEVDRDEVEKLSTQIKELKHRKLQLESAFSIMKRKASSKISQLCDEQEAICIYTERCSRFTKEMKSLINTGLIDQLVEVDVAAKHLLTDGITAVFHDDLSIEALMARIRENAMKTHALFS